MAFVGTWKLVETEGFSEFLAHLDFPEEVRNVITQTKDSARLTITQDGEKYHVKSETAFRTSEYDFEDGTETTEEIFGMAINFKTTKESDTKYEQVGSNEKGELHLVREIVGDQLINTATLKSGAVLKLVWEKI